MGKRLSLLLLAGFLVTAATPEKGVPVVMISIDGLRPDYVWDADHYGLRIPNLRRLLREGASAHGVKGVLPTVTYPSHTTLVTGVAPLRHGILYNEPFDPLNRNLGGWYWYAEDIKMPTLWDAVRQAGLEAGSVDWPATVGAAIRWNIVQYWRTDFPGMPDDHKLSRLLSTPGLLAEAEAVLGPYPSGYAYTVEADESRASFDAWMITTRKPRLQLAYFGALDEEEHDSWPGSPATLAILERLDALVGRVREAADRAYGGRFALAVVSDHGHSKTTREFRLNEALRQGGLILVNEAGHTTDWRAYGWGTGGSSAIMLKDPGDEETRRKVLGILAPFQKGPDAPIQAVLDAQQTRDAGGFPGAAFLVGVNPDVRIGARMEEPILAPGLPLGEHGHLADNTVMDASFLVVGPGVPAARDLGRIDMRDVAPTLANLLGVRLPGSEGHDVLGR
jgi:predicted AlkP superfamily pyrophosphatase or phosphodiesterase